MDKGKLQGKNQFQLSESGIIESLLSVLFPLRCVHCGQAGYWLCPECAAKLQPLGKNLCSGRDLRFRSARAAFVFEGPARSLVHRLKYSGQRRLAVFMADIACNEAGLTGPDKAVTLTYVPLHRSKLLNRGYNQAELFAGALSRRLGLPLRDLLCKHHPTMAQNQLGFDERRRNLEGSFGLRRGARLARGSESIVLVDDVFTTGSTASECARTLQELGAEVDVWTFARTVKLRQD